MPITPILLTIEDANGDLPTLQAFSNNGALAPLSVVQSVDDLVALGVIPTRSFVHKFGFTTSAGTNDNLIVWDGAADDTDYPFQDSAVQLVVYSSNAGDVLGGAGAEKVEVAYLDANGEEARKEVELDGTNEVDLAMGVASNRARISQTAIVSQLDDQALGDISIGVTGGGDVLSIIKKEYAQTQQAVYTVPDNASGVLENWYVNKDGDKDTLSHLAIWSPSNPVWLTKFLTPAGSGASPSPQDFTPPFLLEAGSRVMLVVHAVASGTRISGGFTIKLIAEE